MRLKQLYSWSKRTFFRTLKETESHRIYQKMKRLKDWRKNVLFNKGSDKVMRLQDKGNRFIIVDKQTHYEKANFLFPF